jgi:hypothetical protein
MVAGLSQSGDDALWNRWGNIGQAFGVLGAVVSGLALVALGVTFAMQFRELQAHRASLRYGAEIELRKLHVDLIKLALGDPDLAAVWPPFPGATAERTRQYRYANLILQHAWLRMKLDACTEEQMQSNLRYLFASPLVREYWRVTEPSRNSNYVAGTMESYLAEAADGIYREYESVLACST